MQHVFANVRFGYSHGCHPTHTGAMFLGLRIRTCFGSATGFGIFLGAGASGSFLFNVVFFAVGIFFGSGGADFSLLGRAFAA